MGWCMKIRLVGSRVLVREQESGNLKSSVIYIPETAKGMTQEGVVEIVGEGYDFGDNSPKVDYINEGDKILFGKKGVMQIQVNGENRLIMHLETIIGVCND